MLGCWPRANQILRKSNVLMLLESVSGKNGGRLLRLLLQSHSERSSSGFELEYLREAPEK
jgi:hypothetical protein